MSEQDAPVVQDECRDEETATPGLRQYLGLGVAVIVFVLVGYGEVIAIGLLALGILVYAALHPAQAIDFLEVIAPFVAGLIGFIVLSAVTALVVGFLVSKFMDTSELVPDV